MVQPSLSESRRAVITISLAWEVISAWCFLERKILSEGNAWTLQFSRHRSTTRQRSRPMRPNLLEWFVYHWNMQKSRDNIIPKPLLFITTNSILKVYRRYFGFWFDFSNKDGSMNTRREWFTTGRIFRLPDNTTGENLVSIH